MATNAPVKLAQKLLGILAEDRERLVRIDDYLHGRHDDPYMPSNADTEYRLLAKRAVSNWTPLLVGTPAQALYVDGFRTGEVEDATAVAKSPVWTHWEASGLGARQASIHRGALAYGHSFTVTEKDKAGRVRTRGLSALRTSAVFEDAANDHSPYAMLTITKMPVGDAKGLATMWDDTHKYVVSFKALSDLDSVRCSSGQSHGNSECPGTRFAASVDLEGRTVGVVEPMIPLQNRINQTVFDLLVAQTYGSFKVRYVTGMAPPVYRDPETGEVQLDENGQPKALPMDHNARRFLFAEDENVKFGSLDETPLGGFIESIDMSIRHLAAVSQTPPHHLLGQIANLSAEALLAAETALARKVAEFKAMFGESWERVFRLAAELLGDLTGAEDVHGEVLWRDMEQRSLAQAADALGKLKDQLGIPRKGLWKRVPNVTQSELNDWENMAEDEDSVGRLADAVKRATPGRATQPAPASQ